MSIVHKYKRDTKTADIKTTDNNTPSSNKKTLQRLLLVALSVMLVTAMCPDISRNATAKAKPKNRWSKNGLYYYSKNGKKVSGITVITEKKKNGSVMDSFYVFGKKKKLSARKTLKLRKAAKYEKNFRHLKKIIGKPIKAKYKRGCYNGPVKKGKAVYSGGKDGILKYKNFRVYTYRSPKGKEFFLSVEGTKYVTRITKKNHSVPIGKKARKEGRRVRLIRQKHGRNYCYDGNGTQRAGWQKISGSYYYFKIANGRKGYMIKGKRVNDIRIKKSGVAVIKKKNKRQLRNLMTASRLADKLTTLKMKKKKRLKKLWKYFLNDKHYQYRGSPKFMKTSHWARDNAYMMFTRKHGACYEMGAAFAYLANACGYSRSKAVSSGSHGWAEVNGKICDPSWQKVNPKKKYFMVKMSSSGKKGYPMYRQSRKYVKKI